MTVTTKVITKYFNAQDYFDYGVLDYKEAKMYLGFFTDSDRLPAISFSIIKHAISFWSAQFL